MPTFSGTPTFTVSNSGDGDAVLFSIVHPSDFTYSRIYQTRNISNTQNVTESLISGSTHTISGLFDNTYYWYAMDSVKEISGGAFLEVGPHTGYQTVFVTSNSSGQAAQMQLPRLMDLSLIFFLRDNFESVTLYPSDLDIIDGYPEDKRNLVGRGRVTNAKTQRELPIITVEQLTSTRDGLEMGGRDSDANYNFAIDIFAERDGQRDDLAFLCLKYLTGQTIAVKDYNQGFPPSVTTQTTTGYMSVEEVKTFNTSNKNSKNVVDRHTCRIMATVNVLEIY
jgi:hypothetical protein